MQIGSHTHENTYSNGSWSATDQTTGREGFFGGSYELEWLFIEVCVGFIYSVCADVSQRLVRGDQR